jgi:hypothetical protein
MLLLLAVGTDADLGATLRFQKVFFAASLSAMCSCLLS